MAMQLFKHLFISSLFNFKILGGTKVSILSEHLFLNTSRTTIIFLTKTKLWFYVLYHRHIHKTHKQTHQSYKFFLIDYKAKNCFLVSVVN